MHFLILPSSLSRYSSAPKTKRILQMLWCIFKTIQFVYFYPQFLALGQSLRHVLDKVTWWHFQSTSKKAIWPKNFMNYMHGFRVSFWRFLRKGWDGCTLLMQPSKIHHSIWRILFVLGADEYLERLEGKIRKCLFFYVKIF